MWEAGNAASETSHRGHCSARSGDGTELGVDEDVYVQQREDSRRRVGAKYTTSQIEAATQHTWKTLYALLDTFDHNVGQWLEQTREERSIRQTSRLETRLPGVNVMRAEQVDQQARNASGSLLAITSPDRFLLVWFRACDVLASRPQQVEEEGCAVSCIPSPYGERKARQPCTGIVNVMLCHYPQMRVMRLPMDMEVTSRMEPFPLNVYPGSRDLASVHPPTWGNSVFLYQRERRISS